MPYTVAAKDRMLISVFSGGAVRVALLHGDVEETDPAYQRQTVDFGKPSGTTQRRIENLDDVRFPPYADWPTSDVDGFALYDLAGVELAREALAPKRYEKGDAAIFRKGWTDEEGMIHPGDLYVWLGD